MRRAPRALLAMVALAASGARAQTLSVDVSSGQHPISPDIYGMAFGPGITPPDVTMASQLKLPSLRWGGDAATRYNWQVDSTNAGFDYYFIGGGNDGTPGGQVDSMIATYSYAHALVTIPIIPYVNKGAATSCSFRVSVYGAQQQALTGIVTGDQCGNSIQVDGGQLLDSDIAYNHIDNSVALQQSWVSHLVSTHGTAANGGVPYYQLDNEPGGWSNTHRDVEPVQPNYAVLVALGEQYASAIKTVDPTAKVLGPSDFLDYGWVVNAPPGTSLYSGQYYLQQFAAYDADAGSRSLDDFDEHYIVGDSSSPAASFNQVRTWWDPTYNSGSSFEGYLGGPIMAIPRFKDWVASYYPGTQVSISEYELESTGNSLVDALVEADALGVFGVQGLDLAALFSVPAPTSPVAQAFFLYLNYDGSGSKFGDTSVIAASTDQTQLSVYGATRSSDGALTVVVINKTTAAISTTLTLSGFSAGATAASYLYSNANLTAIAAGAPVAVTGGNTVTNSFPAYSATLLVFAGGVTSATTTGTSTTTTATATTSASTTTSTTTTTTTSTGSGTSTSTGGRTTGTAGTASSSTGRASTAATTTSSAAASSTSGSGSSSSSSSTTAATTTSSSGGTGIVGVGCGCGTSPTAGSDTLWFALAALLFRRRKRR